MNIELGEIYLTKGIAETIEQNALAKLQVEASLKRQMMCDFSDMEYLEDIHQNQLAASRKSGRVFNTFKCGALGKIWVITDFLKGQCDLNGKVHDSNITTVLYPEEY